MFTLIALALLPVSEPTPVGPELVEMVISDPTVAGPACDSYRTMIGLLDGLGTDTTMFVEMIDAFAIVTVESDALRLDNEARTVFTDWLHTSCS